MNFKAPLVFGCVMALGLPVGSAVAGGRNAQSFSRPAAARSAPQRATFRGGQNFQRSSSNWTGNNRFNSFSRPNVNRSTFTGNRTVINSNTANWSRFNRTTNRFGTGWNGSRRAGSADFNRWNWRHRHHRDFDNFVFFGGFGFPFYSPWDYTYYPGAYYP